MILNRRTALALPALLAAPATARAQVWPSRPVNLIVGFPPGGQTDFAARVVQPGLTAALGQPVVIDNRAGVGGNLATEYVARARADGYTLLAGNSSPMTINPHIYANMPVNPLDLVPIGLALQSSLLLCVHPSVPATDLASLVTWLKAQPKGADYGSASAGSLSHCAMELFRSRIGNPAMEHIPYRGSGPAMQDFIAGRFSLMFDGASVVAPFVKAGQLRAILATGERRSPAFPDVPTSAEAGLQGFTFTAWIGLFGPRGLPPEITARAQSALEATLRDEATRARMTNQGDEPGSGTAEEFAALVRRDHARWGEVVRANNITVS